MTRTPIPAARRRRDYRVHARVKVASGVARVLITSAGIGTIAAVCGVLVFLVSVVADAFLPARIGAVRPLPGASAAPLRIGCDEYRALAFELGKDAVLRIASPRDGQALEQRPLVPEGRLPEITAVSPSPIRGCALGFADGTVRPWRVRFETAYFEADQVPEATRGLADGALLAVDGGVVERTPIGQYRHQRLVSELGEALPFGAGAPIVAVHTAARGDGALLAAVTARGEVWVCAAEQGFDPLTGEDTSTWGEPLGLELPAHPGPPRFVLVTDLGNVVHVLWEDGHDARFSLRQTREPRLAEELDLVPEPGARLCAAGVLLGGSTLVAADSRGRVRGWFVRNDPGNAVDGTRLVLGHELVLPGPALPTCVAASERERSVAAGTAAGEVHLWFMPSEKALARVAMPGAAPVTAISFAPKDDGVLAAGPAGTFGFDYEQGHPEVTPRALFGRVWYERYDGPAYVWQSSSGTDAFEKKLSLVPLLFGTVKATLYSMLFGAPLALLAAIYTSEFLHRRTRARVKPAIEMMASLPSVVLGFLAAVVIAPLVEPALAVVLCSLATVPFALLLGAHLWRLLPQDRALRLEAWRLPLAALAIASGVGLALAGAPVAERALFGGDLALWLGGQVGSGFAGWLLLFLPASALGVALLLSFVDPGLQRLVADWSRQGVALLHMGKLVLGTAAVLAAAGGLAAAVWLLPEALSFAAPDLRRGLAVGPFDLSPLGQLDQRNALVVGFMMGFAIIPIIYTIAEDALTAVPDHLRAASLGAGATPWQTALRIVIPTAMSGLSSALMVGLGRAVGETMIVLMAAGNTPVLSLNAFDGFRTLSANIATELPEAVPGSTHYRTLFLAALLLFALTFVINTLAESVRQRFRRRAYQL